MTRSPSILLAALVATALAGCASAPAPAPATPPQAAAPAAPPPPPPPACEAAGAQFAVGQPMTPQLEAAVRARANAASARILKPGQPATMDFNPARVNIDLDARNRVKTVRCG
ncbi:MAG: I78 family peptidase inhibitor [Bordetella sp.]|nr:I78 family peptidase inhibitor [Pseudomonadota bacterium]